MQTTAGMIAGVVATGVVADGGGAAWVGVCNDGVGEDHVGDADTETVCVTVSGAEPPSPQPTIADTADTATKAWIRMSTHPLLRLVHYSPR